MVTSVQENFIEYDPELESDNEDSIENGIDMDFSEEPVSLHVAQN